LLRLGGEVLRRFGIGRRFDRLDHAFERLRNYFFRGFGRVDAQSGLAGAAIGALPARAIAPVVTALFVLAVGNAQPLT